jgi:hypothetical protein
MQRYKRIFGNTMKVVPACQAASALGCWYLLGGCVPGLKTGEGGPPSGAGARGGGWYLRAPRRGAVGRVGGGLNAREGEGEGGGGLDARKGEGGRLGPREVGRRG